MKKIYLIVLVFIFCGKGVFGQTLVNHTDALCPDILDEFGNGTPNVVCLWIENHNTNAFGGIMQSVVTLNCPITIGQDEVLIIPNRLTIQLTDNGVINLTGNGKITGEQINGSRIENTTTGPTINLNSCTDCKISNLTITGGSNEASDIIGKEGIVIAEGSDGNEIDAVKIERVQTGILVEGDSNVFTDLQFVNVGANQNCDPRVEDLNYAVKVVKSNSNEFTNMLHTMSHGAISLWLNDECDGNVALNITIEQEGSDCPKSPLQGDPSLYIDNDLSTNNLIVTNFNGGRIYLPPNFCVQTNLNTIVPRDDCNNSTNTICGN